MEDEHSLLERVQQHDRQALAEVYDQYFNRIHNYIRYRLGEPETAADLTGEVFLALVNAVKAGNAPNVSLTGWLYTVARNVVADYIRGKVRTVPLMDNLEADGPTMTEQVHLSQLAPVLRRAILQLTEDQQHVIALRFGQEMSLAETAEIMDKSVGAIKALQHRALASLARFLPQGVQDDG